MCMFRTMGQLHTFVICRIENNECPTVPISAPVAIPLRAMAVFCVEVIVGQSCQNLWPHGITLHKFEGERFRHTSLHTFRSTRWVRSGSNWFSTLHTFRFTSLRSGSNWIWCGRCRWNGWRTRCLKVLCKQIIAIACHGASTCAHSNVKHFWVKR